MLTVRLAVAAALVAIGIAPAVVYAQERPPSKKMVGKGGPGRGKFGGPFGKAKTANRGRNQLDLLQRMSPDERRQALDNLPPERKRVMEERLRQFENMSPQERRQARRMLDNFENLPPERRQRVRRLFGEFNRMPDDRRNLLREEMRTLNNLDQDERAARVSSDEFRSRYSESERQWLDDLTKALHDK